MKTRAAAYGKLITSMVIFGSIGLFVRNIALSSSAVAMFRAIIGCLFLLVISLFQRKRLSLGRSGRQLPVLLLSGVALGFNWILLFESYRYTSVAVSTLCYYTAPILVLLLSPLLLKEWLTPRKLVCVIPTAVGMVLISGILTASHGESDGRGIVLGLCAAVLYASVVVLNKMQKELPSFDRTFFQLGIAGLILVPYNLAAGALPTAVPDSGTLLLLGVVGVVHTGLAYYLYFGALRELPGQTAAVLSYVDPVVAVAISVLLLREGTSWQEMAGAVLILGAAVISELPTKRKEADQ